MVVENHAAPARPVDRAGAVVGGSRRRPRTPSGEVSSVTDLLEQMISLRRPATSLTCAPDGLVAARARKRRRANYKRWQRPGPMQLWQLDVMGSVRLVDGTEAKLISGVDDHSRFAVIATVVARASGRAVCAAFAGALVEYGITDQVLTNNGKQFTGKYGRPRPAEVLFDRICRKDGIEHLLTKIRSPTTTGKVERWHQSIQRELLDEHPPFASVAAAQAAVEAWRIDYNTTRPHQALDMAAPADRFHPVPEEQRERLSLWLPTGLVSADRAPAQQPALQVVDGASDLVSTEPEVIDPHSWTPAAAVELERAVPPSGNLAVGRQQFWFGPHRAGEVISLWIDSTTVHLSSNGRHLKTVPSRLSDAAVTRLLRSGARPAGPPPATRLPGRMLEGKPIEVDRIVNRQGTVSLGHEQLQAGSPLAGQRVTIRLDGQLAHVVLSDGTLWRTVAFSLSQKKRARLHGARPAGPPPTPPSGPVRVQRLVSCRDGIQVIGQRVQVGLPHARKTVTVEVDDTTLRVLDEREKILKVVSRTTTEEVTRHKAYGHRSYQQA
jgi:transposase InsO family protein